MQYYSYEEDRCSYFVDVSHGVTSHKKILMLRFSQERNSFTLRLEIGLSKNRGPGILLIVVGFQQKPPFAATVIKNIILSCDHYEIAFRCLFSPFNIDGTFFR